MNEVRNLRSVKGAAIKINEKDDVELDNDVELADNKIWDVISKGVNIKETQASIVSKLSGKLRSMYTVRARDEEKKYMETLESTNSSGLFSGDINGGETFTSGFRYHNLPRILTSLTPSDPKKLHSDTMKLLNTGLQRQWLVQKDVKSLRENICGIVTRSVRKASRKYRPLLEKQMPFETEVFK